MHVTSLLVLAVLLGMWGFVLFPLVRLRNSRVDELRSVARFSSALRVLSGGQLGARRTPVGRPGYRQFHMPPREGFAAARAARTPAATVGVAARRRRQILAGTSGFFVLSVFLVAVAGMWFVQVLADFSLAGGVLLCRWSVEQERVAARRASRRSRTAVRRSTVPAVAGYLADSDVPVERPRFADALPVMTVPLDAPALPRRAVTPLAASASPASAPEAAARPATPARPARPAKRPAPAAEPVVLAEIDIDWEPAVLEPASLVRLIDLSKGPGPIFDDADETIDVGDDAGLDVLIARRATASGW